MKHALISTDFLRTNEPEQPGRVLRNHKEALVGLS